MSSKSAQRAVGKLEQKKLISKEARVIGYQKDQGIEFRVVPAPRQVLETRQTSQTRLVPETAIKDNTQTDTLTQAGVSAGSRFTLEECRRYADHLHRTGQGIDRPGGYATTIYRSGEADSMIEAWLNPPAQIDISQCPDCEGRGFIYVDQTNHDKGVRPCKHERLRA